ncbi:MAG: SpoIID/LytB domain-containing protein [Lachnospiraceae bacterium]|nr:SpoIID/LytB domain-containing protein [Lachnospiraceae bacterium]MBD5483568.1 SpoIID/LytB domain-containing protein [Lachnospiraceae bacterium]
MGMQNDADRREALSRAMRQSSGGGGRRGMKPGHGYIESVLFSCLLLVILLCGGMVLWSYANHKPPFYVLVGDRSGNSAEDDGREKAAEDGQENRTGGMKELSGQVQIPYEVPETVRVLLMNSDFSSVYHDQLVLKGRADEITIMPAALRETFDEVREQLLQEGFLLEREGERYVLKPHEAGTGTEGNAQNSGRLKILSISRACGTPSYRGCLYLYVRDDQLVLVNELSLEEYLYNVLPSEMPASYHEEALKAQAVCARTYACAVMENPRYPDFDAHLDDSTSCQMYGNLEEHENTTAAVEQTKGEILLFQGRPVSTYYYSTSCGIGSDISVWQGFAVEEHPYLQGRSQNAAHEELQLTDDTEFAAYLATEHEDVESAYPWYRWSCQISGVNADTLYEKLKERYQVKQESVELVGMDTESRQMAELPYPGRIRMLSIDARSPSGCAICLLIEGENCSYRIYGEYNVRYLLCDGDTTVTRQDGSTAVMRTILPSAYLILTPSLDKEELIGYSIIGGGYGHGVGMSQNGADTLAALGVGYRDILDYYYIGTEWKAPKN